MTALNNLGSVNRTLGNRDLARAYTQQVLELEGELGERPGVAIALNNLGTIDEDDGDLVTAAARYQEALSIARELGNLELQRASLGNLGNLYEGQERLEEALATYEEAIAVCEEIRVSVGAEELRTSVAELCAAVYERAARLRLAPWAGGRRVQSDGACPRAIPARPACARPDRRAGWGGLLGLVAAEQSLRLELGALERSLQEEQGKRTASQNREVISSISEQLAAKQREYAEALTGLKVGEPGVRVAGERRSAGPARMCRHCLIPIPAWCRTS